ncbi:MAG: HlyC/CorC family transporter [Anaerolineae bacterium]|nr:HlyC/CorC family transporter [Phycisphaerae bacterium]
MTPVLISLLVILLAATVSLLFSSLTYSLRDFSRPKLSERLNALGMSEWYERTVERAGDLIFVTAFGRLFANLFVFIGVLHATYVILGSGREWTRYGIAVVITSIITLFVSVAIPHALAEHVGEALIAHSARFLHGLRLALRPVTRIMHMIDRMVCNLAGRPDGDDNSQLEQEIEQEILSAVEEGEKEGVVDVQEREMIHSVIHFGDITVADAMTARSDIMGVPLNAHLEQVKSIFEESGHSRLPVFDGTLDKIVGVLYSRDLIRLLGEPADAFNVKLAMRAPVFVPQSKPLRDLLNDFREHKVHMAIVLDEYGGTAGLVTIEDVFKKLVGEISDEHAPSEPSMLKRVDEKTADVDAQIYIEQINRLLNLDIPEDAGYETLGGFVSTTLGRIPEPGASFERNGVRYTIIDAEPQRVNHVRIEQLAPSPATTGVTNA